MDNGYTIIDNSVFSDNNLKPMEKLTLICLIRYYNAKKGYSYPTIEKLKNDLGYSHARYVRENLKKLEEKSYIAKKTIGRRNIYYILIGVQNVPYLKNLIGVQNVPYNEVQNVPYIGVQIVPTTNTNTITKTNTIYNNIFELWNSKNIIYQEKLTQGIKKAITNALSKYGEDEILEAIEIYSEILNSSYFFNYKWTLLDFLRKTNALSSFVKGGNNRVKYENSLKGGIDIEPYETIWPDYND